jgi:RNA polymerase sigma factor (sigma-70 family)
LLRSSRHHLSADVNVYEPGSVPDAYSRGSTTAWNNTWRHIYDQFAPAILAYARRGGLNDYSAEDVLQEVMTTLIRCQHSQTAGYNSSQGSFQAWLWGVIRNRVRSVRRQDQKHQTTSSIPQTAFDETGPGLSKSLQTADCFERSEEEQWQRALLAAAMRRVQQRVTARNFEIYQALLKETTTSKELAELYQMEPNAVYAVKHRCEQILLCEAQAIRETWEHLERPPCA